MRRGISAAVVALSLSALCLSSLAACTDDAGGAPPSPSADPSSVGASASTGPVTLRFGVYGDPQTLSTYRRLADVWTEKHPDVTIDLVRSKDAETAHQRLDASFERGDAPDVFLADHELLPDLVAEQRVQPVDELLEQRGVLFGDNYQRIGLEAFSADSALQCMPHDVSPLVVFYNTRLLKPRTLATPDEPAPSAEEGWTWEQFTTAARRMSHDGVRGVYVAPRLETLLPLVRSAGDDLVDDARTPTTLTTSDDGARDALEQVLTLVRDRRVTPSPAQLARRDALGRFEDGRLGMMLGTRRLVPKLREAEGLRFDVLPLPSLGRDRTIAEMTGYCLSSDTEHQAAAADFLAFASSEEGAKVTANLGGVVPANLQALHSDAFVEPGLQPSTTLVFSEALRRADPLPFVRGWSAVEDESAPLLEQMFYDPVLDLDDLLPRIDARSAELLAPPEDPAS